MKSLTAVCPGSFDPITHGHLDIIKRASNLFEKVIVVVMTNDEKTTSLFSIDERKDLIEKAVKSENLNNVQVDTSQLLLADYCKQKNAKVIVKGLRAVSDFEYEFQMALTNKKLNPDADTVFLTTDSANMYLSSSLVKNVGSRNGDISPFVPECIHDIIKNKFKKEKGI
ncbi:MAG: pantetheine-phosphate adenylyltransferase [Acutalibacteraceae bacterium]|nr:pantetheine-phosphate adenylyltransferase [Acutalibacteraceae bacterium]